MRRYQKSAFTMVELLVVIAIIGVLMSLLLPAVQKARESGRSAECKNNLKQLGLAFNNFSSRHGTMPTYDGLFPPRVMKKVKSSGAGGFVEVPDSAPRLAAGWFVHLLPDLDHQVLYDRMLNMKPGETGVDYVQVDGVTITTPPSADFKAAYCERNSVKLPDYVNPNSIEDYLRQLFWHGAGMSVTDGYAWVNNDYPGNCTHTPAVPQQNGSWDHCSTGPELERTCDGSGNKVFWSRQEPQCSTIPGYWQGRAPGQEFVGANLSEDTPPVYIPAQTVCVPPQTTLSSRIVDAGSWSCTNAVETFCTKNGVRQTSIGSATSCGQWVNKGIYNCYPQQGSGGGSYTTKQTVGVQITPTGVEIPFEELHCYSDPSPTRPMAVVSSPARAGAWSLTNYLANFFVLTVSVTKDGPGDPSDPSSPFSPLNPQSPTNPSSPNFDPNFKAPPGYYPGNVAEGVMADEEVPSLYQDVSDGASNTILFAEAMRECNPSYRFAFWSRWKPHKDDVYTGTSLKKPNTHNFGIDWDGNMTTNMFQANASVRYCGAWYVQAMHGDSLNVCMLDGSVRAINSNISRGQENDPDRPGKGEIPKHPYRPSSPNEGIIDRRGVWDFLMDATDGQIIRDKY